jgi:hypothetical protein
MLYLKQRAKLKEATHLNVVYYLHFKTPSSRIRGRSLTLPVGEFPCKFPVQFTPNAEVYLTGASSSDFAFTGPHPS